MRDPRVLALLLDRLQFDAGDGALCLELYHDSAARPALETMLAEIPAEEVELRRDIAACPGGTEPGRAARTKPKPFDILAEYPSTRAAGLRGSDESGTDALDRVAGCGRSAPPRRTASSIRSSILRHARLYSDLAQSDPDAKVRGRAWESLGDAVSAKTRRSIRDAMLAVLTDTSRDIDERGGAAVGCTRSPIGTMSAGPFKLCTTRTAKGARQGPGIHVALAVEALRQLLPPHLEDPSTRKSALRQAIRGAGYFRSHATSTKSPAFSIARTTYEDLREDALFAYALAMPGETTRGRVRGMLRKIDDSPVCHRARRSWCSSRSTNAYACTGSIPCSKRSSTKSTIMTPMKPCCPLHQRGIRWRKARSQRSMPLRQRQEVQKVPRSVKMPRGVAAGSNQ